MTIPDEARMSASVWGTYDYIAENGPCRFHKPLPGWRVDRVYPDGTISDYRDDGTRLGRCLRPKPFWMSDIAIEHGRDCFCGYRVVRDVYTLLQYVLLAEKSAPGTNFGARCNSH